MGFKFGLESSSLRLKFETQAREGEADYDCDQSAQLDPQYPLYLSALYVWTLIRLGNQHVEIEMGNTGVLHHHDGQHNGWFTH